MSIDKNTTCLFETPQVIDYTCNYCGEYGHVQSFRIPANLELDVIVCV